jgi:hypothetical protein
MSNKTKESKISAGQFREKVTAFFAKWRDRVESGWSDENTDAQVLHIDSHHIDSETDEFQYAHMILAFQHGSDGVRFFVDFRSSVTEPMAKIIFYPDRLTGWGEDRSPLVVTYSEIHGKRLQIQPREFDGPWVTYDELDFVEWLFNEMTADLGLVPEKPFDFSPIRRYYEEQQETLEKALELWSDLSSSYWYAIAEAWDNHLSD